MAELFRGLRPVYQLRNNHAGDFKELEPNSYDSVSSGNISLRLRHLCGRLAIDFDRLYAGNNGCL